VALGLSVHKRKPNRNENPEAPPPKRTKKAEATDTVDIDGGSYSGSRPDSMPQNLKSSSPFVPQKETLLPSSQSRVDENGSPRARTATIEETSKIMNFRSRALPTSTKMVPTDEVEADTVEERDFDAHNGMHPTYDENENDDDLITEPFGETRANDAVQLPIQDRENIFMSHYPLHKSSAIGKKLNIFSEKDIQEAAFTFVDPFKQRKPRQLSDFAKRLKGEKPARAKVTITTDNVLPLKVVNDTHKKRSILFETEVTGHDPEKTLVDVENQGVRGRVMSPSEESSASLYVSNVGDKLRISESDTEKLAPEMEWRKALKPHQKNLTDTLYCMVHVS
jgi:hypothetical protein